MFNFFKKKQAEPEEIELASIKIHIGENSQEPRIAINLEEYDDKSLNSLAKLVNLLTEDSLVIETINIIKNFCMESNQEEVLLFLLSQIHNTQYIKKMEEEQKSSKPCIKPSELYQA